MRRIGPAVALTLLASLAPAASRADSPAVFRVGFAVRDITPASPQYLGGFGMAPPVSRVHDPLQVRAMAVRSGDSTVAFAIVDSQGWFAGYQEGPWGVTDARNDAAAALTSAGVAVEASGIIVSSTHSHAAPTIMGIWGSTDAAYLEHVHDQTVSAIVEAATNTADAELWAADADIGSIIGSAVSETDVYQGWAPDEKTPILWAREPGTGATLGLYANIPVHADVVIGKDCSAPTFKGCISADHIGVERDSLDALLGGTSVVAMGTLGRQESFVQGDGHVEAARVGSFVTNQVLKALGAARPLTDPTVTAADQYIAVPVTNPLLAGLNYANASGHSGPDGDASTCDVACPIDRSILPPYVVGPTLGTWVTAFRIGDLVYATEPGEAFPEVSTSIRQAMGASDVRIVGMAQDQLGYFYPPETYPWTEFNNSDHQIYNASLFLADEVVHAQALNAARLGFTPSPAHETSQFDDVGQARRAGVQFIPARREQAGTGYEFEAATTGAAFDRAPSAITMGALPGSSFTGPIAWDFGDGSALSGGKLVTHVYPGPGTYTVTATITANGATSSWTEHVIVDPEPVAGVVLPSSTTAVATLAGGEGSIVAAHWAFSGGGTADGVSVARPAGAAGSVVVVDAAGNTAQAAF